MATKRARPRQQLQTALRFSSEEQRDLIKRAAEYQDTSVNAFVRSAAEKCARELLGLPRETPASGKN